jgi:hypothetical protein
MLEQRGEHLAGILFVVDAKAKVAYDRSPTYSTALVALITGMCHAALGPSCEWRYRCASVQPWPESSSHLLAVSMRSGRSSIPSGSCSSSIFQVSTRVVAVFLSSRADVASISHAAGSRSQPALERAALDGGSRALPSASAGPHNIKPIASTRTRECYSKSTPQRRSRRPTYPEMAAGQVPPM